MAGICSEHQDFDPSCRLCSKTPHDLLPDWDDKTREAECAGLTPCPFCGMVLYRSVSGQCPKCRAQVDLRDTPPARINDTMSVLLALEKLVPRRLEAGPAIGYDVRRLVWMLPGGDLDAMASTAWLTQPTPWQLMSVVCKALWKRCAALPLVPSMSGVRQKLEDHWPVVVQDPSLDAGAEAFLEHALALLALIWPKGLEVKVAQVLGCLSKARLRELRNHLHELESTRGFLPTIAPSIAMLDEAYKDLKKKSVDTDR